jgi:nitrogen fixation protein NifB
VNIVLNSQEILNLKHLHPCFNQEAARRYARLHLPVAPACNIKCRYCTRLYDCANENRPGVTSQILTPEKALDLVGNEVAGEPRLKVVGIAGPGEPLANQATLQTLKLVHHRFPQLIKCLSTNGLLLSENLKSLKESGVKAVTVTVNNISPRVGEKIYRQIAYQGKDYFGTAGAALLWQKQKEGIEAAVTMGMLVKINSVVIAGINDAHLQKVAQAVREAGAHVMNIIPLIPQGEFARLKPPTQTQLFFLREKLAPVISQITHCRRCRADARGMLC